MTLQGIEVGNLVYLEQGGQVERVAYGRIMKVSKAAFQIRGIPEPIPLAATKYQSTDNSGTEPIHCYVVEDWVSSKKWMLRN